MQEGRGFGMMSGICFQGRRREFVCTTKLHITNSAVELLDLIDNDILQGVWRVDLLWVHDRVALSWGARFNEECIM